MPVTSPKKSQIEPEENPDLQNYSYRAEAYRGKGRNGKKGFTHRKELSSERLVLSFA